jgi:hypothetical protein
MSYGVSEPSALKGSNSRYKSWVVKGVVRAAPFALGSLNCTGHPHASRVNVFDKTFSISKVRGVLVKERNITYEQRATISRKNQFRAPR